MAFKKNTDKRLCQTTHINRFIQSACKLQGKACVGRKDATGPGAVHDKALGLVGICNITKPLLHLPLRPSQLGPDSRSADGVRTLMWRVSAKKCSGFFWSHSAYLPLQNTKRNSLPSGSCGTRFSRNAVAPASV